MDIKLNEVERYFREKLLAHGNTAEGMDWKNQDTQYLRFERIVRFMEFSDNPSLLDVGSGASEFLQYCLDRNLHCDYTGIDIVPEMTEAANMRFGKEVAYVHDVRSMPEGQIFDYVIASGTYNAKLGASAAEWEEFFFDSLKSMFSLCRKALIFNCMSQHVDWEYDRLYYPDAGRLSSFIVKNLSRRFQIDHAYPLFEMTVCIEKAQ
jgi:cyclopropane fatty-acyl-phospholipid synthase-like methyltransferase